MLTMLIVEYVPLLILMIALLAKVKVLPSITKLPVPLPNSYTVAFASGSVGVTGGLVGGVTGCSG
ncbi:hypothetical protein D3C87_1676200 [compost metagenome]